MKIVKRASKAVRLIFKRPGGFWDYCLGIFCALFQSRRNLGRPVHITIEPINSCNLRCPVCETGSGSLKRPKLSMAYEDFKKIIDKIYQHTNSILFYHMGEPFQNPDSYRMIGYAKHKGLYITTCTNGHFIDAKKLVDCGIDEVSFQIGGLNQQSHAQYRVGSDLKEIIKNIEDVISHKKSLNKIQPKVILGFIVMKHNEHEIKGFFELAKRLNVDEARIFNPCVRNWEQGKQLLTESDKYWSYDREAFAKGELRPKKSSRNRCNWIYISTVISCNGDVVPCCRDVDGDFVMGNILKEDLKVIWNSAKYRNFRKSIASRKDDLSICKLCSSFEIPDLYDNRASR